MTSVHHKYETLVASEEEIPDDKKSKISELENNIYLQICSEKVEFGDIIHMFLCSILRSQCEAGMGNIMKKNWEGRSSLTAAASLTAFHSLEWSSSNHQVFEIS